jgi:glutaminase
MNIETDEIAIPNDEEEYGMDRNFYTTLNTTTTTTTAAAAAATSVNTSQFSIPSVCCNDVLLDLYWYIKRTRRQQGQVGITATTTTAPNDCLIFDDIRLALQKEGILFWRDQRYNQSQKVALKWIQEESAVQNDMEEVLEQQGKDKVEEPNIDGESTTVNGPVGAVDISEGTKQQVDTIPVPYGRFVDLVSPCARLFLKAFNEENVIPDWSSFVSDLNEFYHKVKTDTTGETAQYIPLLRDANPDRFGVSCCSVDGQRVSIGDATVKHSLQSVSKPVTYAMALAREGEEFMEQWIDVEPAGRPFNTQDLDPMTQRPFNASVNSGAIMAAGVVASGFPPETTWREIVDQVRAKWTELCGDDMDVGFSDETFVSEKATAYNNFAIAYNLKGRRGLPRNVDLHTMLDVYLGCCSIEITTEALSVVAATLANGGICPITDKEVFPVHVVRAVLAETMTCGMYNQAGRFAVEVGLPAKSGVSGALMVMVPNLLGLATFSPRLNTKGNSVRGIAFCRNLVQCYRLHLFEPLRSGNTGAKIDPRQNGWKDEQKRISHLAWAASVGDEDAIRLRDIFLDAVARTAIASDEGLSDRKISIIKAKYEQIFMTKLDRELAKGHLDRVRMDPNDFSYLEDLTHKAVVTDSMKEVIFSAMIEIAMSDGVVDCAEKEVALRIAQTVLSIDEHVAMLELGRYENQVGHRFEHVDLPDMIENVRASVVGPAKFTNLSSSSLSSRSLNDPPTAAEEETKGYENKEEAFLLRKSIVTLGQRLHAITRRVLVSKQEANKKSVKQG